MKHRIKRANTAQPRVVLYGSPHPVDVDSLIEYLAELVCHHLDEVRHELVWHYKNGRK